MSQFDLREFATVAEQTAKQKALDEDTTKRMTGEACRIEGELADALFDPYVGRTIRIGNKPYRLVRALVRSWDTWRPLGLVPVDPTKPPALPGDLVATADQRDRYFKGWDVRTEWKATDHPPRMVCTLHVEREGGGYDRETDTSGGPGDVGSQAIVLAHALAAHVGKMLVLEPTPAPAPERKKK
jgi:hypothetical protein